MSYSRRQLEAFGEPLGDCVTRKEGGRIIYGGGGSSAPSTQTTVSDLPDWAKPTAERTIAKSEALTSDKPYQSYGSWAKGQGMDPTQVAGFTPLQQQSFQSAGQMGPSGALPVAQGIAGAAAMQGLGTQYRPFQMGQFTADRAAQYMNPFLETAMAPQLREAQRSSEMQRVADMGQATRAGAFGGGRQAIIEAERQRNLGTQLGDIRARGYMSAFDQAQQNFAREQQLREQSRQYGAGLGLQGLQTALQGAGQLGALGGQEFGQAKETIGLQSQLGTQQQQLEQQRINAAMQEYANQQKYPYQQLEFMSNILRGTPMGTVQTLYGAQPTMLQNVGALGLGAYGMSKMFAKGGSVTDEGFVADVLERLSDEQLSAEMQEAAQSGDAARAQLLQAEVSRRAQMRGQPGVGLGGIFSEQMADRVLPTNESMARGGIVAFAGDDEEEGQLVRSTSFTPGSPTDYAYFLGKGKELFEEMGKAPLYQAMTPEQQMKFRADYIKQLQEGAGESPYKKRLEGIGAEQAALGENLEKAKGIGALRAAAGLLQGRGLMQGLGLAGGAFADTYEKAEAANRTEKRALRDMEFNLLDAQRKERMGLNKEATAALREVDRDKALAVKARNDRLAAQGNLARGMAAAAKPQKPGAGAGKAKESKVPEQLAAAEIAFANDPSPANEKRVAALRKTADRLRTSDVGPGRMGVEFFRTTSTADTEVEKQVRASKFMDPAWMDAYEKGDKQAMAAAEDAIANRIRGRRTAVPPGTAGPRVPPASAPVNTNSGQGQPVRLRFDAQGNLLP